MTLDNASQPVVLLFSGQGNPVIGMGSDLWDLNSTTKQIWDCASDISGLDLRRLCLKGPMNRLIQTTYSSWPSRRSTYRSIAFAVSVSPAFG